MNNETLSKALDLQSKIKVQTEKLESLNKDLNHLNIHEYSYVSFTVKEVGSYQRKKDINIKIDKKFLISNIKNEVYIAENLIKKYLLEFEKL
jgi:hypothetical protein